VEEPAARGGAPAVSAEDDPGWKARAAAAEKCRASITQRPGSIGRVVIGILL
jgi:hypothetical protein